MTVFGYSKQQRVVGYGVLAGVVLTIIGIRFLLWPDSAALTFGLGRIGSSVESSGHGLHYVVGLRDIWLGVLAIAFALSRAFTPLSLWFLLGALVCFSDAATVLAFGGPVPAIVFHVVSGIFCGGVGVAAQACAGESRGRA